jgi:hypothetical protein
MQYNYADDTVEYAIEQHLRQQLSFTIPNFDNRAIVITIADGSSNYSNVRGYGAICTEILMVSVMISSEKPLDRLPILKAFPRGGIESMGFKLRQEYKGHKFRNYADILRSKGTSLEFRYEHCIEDKDG